MVINVLGTASGHTSRERRHYSVFIEDAGQNILVDCGCHTAQWLLNHNYSANTPDLIFLSHAHNDHIGQFYNLIQSLWLRKRKKPLPIYGPGKLLTFLEKHLPNHLLFPEMLGFDIDWHHINDQKSIKINSWKLTPFLTSHLDWFKENFQDNYPEVCYECFGFELQTPSSNICISGDIGKPQDLIPTIKKQVFDILICELAHFEPAELFTTLKSSKLATLILMHYGDEFEDKEKNLKKEAAKLGCKFALQLAKDNSNFTFAVTTHLDATTLFQPCTEKA